MAAQESKQMMIYKLSALIGDRTRTLQVAAWNETDAMRRAERRLISEGVHLFTLSILDKKEIQ
jgi:hypothetical protein